MSHQEQRELRIFNCSEHGWSLQKRSSQNGYWTDMNIYLQPGMVCRLPIYIERSSNIARNSNIQQPSNVLANSLYIGCQLRGVYGRSRRRTRRHSQVFTITRNFHAHIYIQTDGSISGQGCQGLLWQDQTQSTQLHIPTFNSGIQLSSVESNGNNGGNNGVTLTIFNCYNQSLTIWSLIDSNPTQNLGIVPAQTSQTITASQQASIQLRNQANTVTSAILPLNTVNTDLTYYFNTDTSTNTTGCLTNISFLVYNCYGSNGQPQTKAPDSTIWNVISPNNIGSTGSAGINVPAGYGLRLFFTSFISDVYTIPMTQANAPEAIYFQADGRITILAQGQTPDDSITCAPNNQLPPTDPGPSFWQTYLWVIIAVVILVIILLVILFHR